MRSNSQSSSRAEHQVLRLWLNLTRGCTAVHSLLTLVHSSSVMNPDLFSQVMTVILPKGSLGRGGNSKLEKGQMFVCVKTEGGGATYCLLGDYMPKPW